MADAIVRQIVRDDGRFRLSVIRRLDGLYFYRHDRFVDWDDAPPAWQEGHPPSGLFASAAEAETDAQASVEWLGDQCAAMRARIGRLLLTEWDPIEIHGVGPDDEYDQYADKVYAMLRDEGATETAIADYLLCIATDHMRLAHEHRLTERSDRVAKRLMEMRPQLGWSSR